LAINKVSMSQFSHLTEKGELHMVDISKKVDTERVAIAKAEVIFPEEIYPKIISQDVPKGDFLTCAKVAGIFAAKRTSELIPLCHPLPISKIDIKFNFIPEKFAFVLYLLTLTQKQDRFLWLLDQGHQEEVLPSQLILF